MNLDYIAQRLLGRATCHISKRAKLGRSARIRNLSGDSGRISMGRHSIVQGELLVFAHGGRITIGEWCYVGEHSRIWAATSIAIGDRVLIAHGVNIFDSLTHPLSAGQRHIHFKQIAKKGHPTCLNLGERPVVISNDAWIGAGAFVLRGVTIGEGAIVAAGSVVTTSVPSYCMIAGNPGRVVRQLTAEDR